jgi:predicted ester cyclase
LIEELAVSDRYIYKVPGHEGLRGQSFKDFVSTVRAAFPDLRNTIESQVAEGDLVVTRGTTRGTQRGPFAGIAPTGKSIEVAWVIFTSFQNGRIVADWELYDALGMMTQLGALTASAQTT